jgi:hypothetical protein
MNAKFPCRRPVVARPVSVRPTLEALDDRLVLSAVGGLGSAGAILPPTPVQGAEVTQKGREIVVTKPTEIVVTKDNDSAATSVRLRRIVMDATTLHDEAVHPAVATMSFQWGAGRGIDAANTTAVPTDVQSAAIVSGWSLGAR